MRSSKSRSRSKSNRPRTIGNIVNRVFDSSGPEGKVRGTPQQIIEKYLILARDAQLSNDRVAAENFLQHAEHYTRMLGEAQRELAAEQEARQNAYQQNGQQGRDRPEGRADYREAGQGDQPDLADPMAFPGSEEDSPLVETPEARLREPQQGRYRDRDQNRDGQRDGGQRDGGQRDGGRENFRDRNRDRNRDQNRDQNRDRPRENREPRPPRPEFDAPRSETLRAEAPAPDAAPVTAPQAAPAPAPHSAEPPVATPLFDAASLTAPEAAPKPKKPAAPRKPRVEKPKSAEGDAPDQPGTDSPAKPRSRAKPGASEAAE